MGAAYSQDLRDLVINAIESGEFSQRELAEHLQVNVGYVESVMRRYRQTGSRAAKPWNAGRLRVLRAHHDWVRGQVSQTLGLTLAELRVSLQAEKQVKVTLGMLCRELVAMALMRKKNRFTTASAIARG